MHVPRAKAPAAHRKFEGKIDKALKTGTKIKVSEMPRREILILYYEWRGYNVVAGRSGKYVTMEKPGQPERKVFIGKNGGLAIGQNISSATHINVDHVAIRANVSLTIRKAHEKKQAKVELEFKR